MSPSHTDCGEQVFDKILTWFANLWFAFALLCMIVDVIIFTAPSIWSGSESATDKWLPLNVVHFIVGLTIVGLIFVWPGLLALNWRDRRREKVKALLRQRLHR
jgi:NADH:ubiquinone oxidoreductase subunit 3 (subunit A)